MPEEKEPKNLEAQRSEFNSESQAEIEPNSQTLPAATLPGLEPSGLYRAPIADKQEGEGRLGEGESKDSPSPHSAPQDELRDEARRKGDSRPETEIINEKVEEAKEESPQQ